MRKSIFKGWICRTWTETSLNGWLSEFDRFDTEDEARQGEANMRKICAWRLAVRSRGRA